VQERYRVFDEAMLRFNWHLGRIYRCLNWHTVQCLRCETRGTPRSTQNRCSVHAPSLLSETTAQAADGPAR
jgi:hypothetical protein